MTTGCHDHPHDHGEDHDPISRSRVRSPDRGVRSPDPEVQMSRSEGQTSRLGHMEIIQTALTVDLLENHVWDIPE